MKQILLLGIILLASTTTAENSELHGPPSFWTISSSTEDSALSMECQGRAPFYKLSCTFTQLSLRRKKLSDAKKAQEDFEKEVKTTPVDKLRQQFKKTCEEASETRNKFNETPQTQGQREYTEKGLAYVESLCTCFNIVNIPYFRTTRQCLLNLSDQIFETESKTCRASTFTSELEFKKVSSRKWISNPGPQGLCDVVNVTTIEHEPNSTSLWTYTQVKVSADTDKSLCKINELHVPLTYSWKSPSSSQMGCEIIKFGVY